MKNAAKVQSCTGRSGHVPFTQFLCYQVVDVAPGHIFADEILDLGLTARANAAKADRYGPVIQRHLPKLSAGADDIFKIAGSSIGQINTRYRGNGLIGGNLVIRL